MLRVANTLSFCSVCKGIIPKGAMASWSPGDTAFAHPKCNPTGEVYTPPPAPVVLPRFEARPLVYRAPEGLDYLPFQREGIHYASVRKGTIIADEMGVGKTIQAIGLINAGIDSAIVVCPASLRINWTRELEKWLVGPVMVDITSYNELSTATELELSQVNYDLVVFDEAHYIKNPASKRTKAAKLLARRARQVICLTGTPVDDAPIDLWPLLQVTCPEVWDPAGRLYRKSEETRMAGPGEGVGFMAYAKRYCGAHKVARWETRAGKRFKTEFWDFSGATHLEELLPRLKETCMIRRLKADVLSELPPKRREVVVYPGDGNHVGMHLPRLTSENYSQVIASLEAGKLPGFTQFSEFRHAAAVDKIPCILGHLESVLAQTQKVIVFAHHLDVIDAIVAWAKEYGCVKLDGRDSEEERQDSVDLFQGDPNCRVFVGALSAAGVGLTLTAASLVVFAEVDYRPSVVLQAEDRPHRIGQKWPVLCQYLVREGTLDAYVAQVLMKKLETVKKVLGE